MRQAANVLIGYLTAVALASWLAIAQTPLAPSSPKLTSERVREPGWWPTKGDAPRKSYLGHRSLRRMPPARGDVAAAYFHGKGGFEGG